MLLLDFEPHLEPLFVFLLFLTLLFCVLFFIFFILNILLFERKVKLDFPLRSAAQRADGKGFFRRVHIAALAANPKHRSFRAVERAVLERLVEVIEFQPLPPVRI